MILQDSIDLGSGQFLLGSTRKRMGGAAAASFAGHVTVIAIAMFIMALVPDPVFELVEVNRQNYEMIWLSGEGPGGGGGGGGNESLELPRMVEVEGQDETPINVPTEEPPDYIEPDVQFREPVLETETIQIPATQIASALKTRIGILEGLMAASTLSEGSGRDGGAGSGQQGGIGPGEGDGLGPGQGGGVGGGIYRPGAGIQIPRPIHEEKPRYTAEAMRAKVQGAVWLDAVVLPDGSVGDVQITKSLDAVFGLDEEAIKAAKQWRFVPGTRFGEPVAVQVTIELTFTLR
jgi:protein TonB